MPPVSAESISNSVGIHLTPPQGFARVNGQRIVVDGTPVAGHGRRSHRNPFTSNGSVIARINGISINRNGDTATCGHPNAAGFAFARIGGASSGFTPGESDDYGYIVDEPTAQYDEGSITDPPVDTEDLGTLS